MQIGTSLNAPQLTKGDFGIESFDKDWTILALLTI
jgi:hypothetical protein